jgi:uncharacterized protein (DUF3084 family)
MGRVLLLWMGPMKCHSSGVSGTRAAARRSCRALPANNFRRRHAGRRPASATASGPRSWKRPAVAPRMAPPGRRPGRSVVARVASVERLTT